MTSLVDSPIQAATQANETASMPLMQTTPAVLSDAVEEKSLFRKVKRAARALTPDAPSAPKAPKTPAKKAAAAARPSAPKKLSTPDAPSASAVAKKVNRATPDVPNKPDAPKAVNAPDKPRSGASGVSKALGGEGGVTGEIRTINGRTWNTDHHPRDASGRFIETGGSARVWGRQETGKVVRTLPDGKVEVEFSDGHRESHASQRLQMIKRPNGDEPTKRVDAVQDEDERRIKDPTRGNGVDADDLGDRDADGVPDYRDAEPDDPNVRASIPNAKPRSMPRASRAPEGEEKRQIPAGEVHRRGRDVYTRHDVAKPNGTLEVGERIDLGTVERDPERTGKFRATTTDGKVILGGTSADTAAQELRRHANGEDVKEWTPNKRRASAAKKVEAASKPEVATPEKISQAQGDALLALDRYNQAKPDIYVDADKLDAPVNGSALVSLSRAGLIERPDSINQNHGYESPSYRLTAKGKKRAAEVAADRAAAGASDKPAARNAKTHAKVAFKRDDEAQRARTSYESFSPEDQFKIDEAVRENIDDFLADPEDAYRKHLSKAGIALGDDTATSRSVNDVIDAARHRIMEDPKLSSHDRRTRLTKSSRHDQASGAVNAASAALKDGNYEEARRSIGEARDFDPDYRRNHREESSLDGMLAHINKTERDSAAERSRITKEDNDEHSRRTGAEGPGVLGDVPAEQGRGDQRPADVLPESRGGSRSAGEGRVGRGNDLDDPEQTDAPAARRTPGNGEGDRPELGNGRHGVPDAGAGNRAEQGSQPRPVGRAGGRGRVAPAEKANAGERFTPRSQGDLAPSGESQKLAANMSALRTLREVQSGNRAATPAEQKVLARWAGWGSLPGVFDENNEKFAAQRAELKELLTPEQYDAARRNTLNAHYTDVDLVDAMWDTMKDLGFTGGDVLEPGSGSGNFIGRAPKGVNMTGVELDPITAGISRLLYPDAEIHNESFGRSTFNDGVFDAVVGNVPFGNFGVIDPRFNPRGQTSIHNHFINKSLASTKPGGVASIITSSHTLDSLSEDARREIYAHSDLIGAVRLPGGAHRRTAGTDVVTDVLMFRKRKAGEAPGDDSWLTSRLATHADGSPILGVGRKDTGPRQLPVNDYFTKNPQNVLGEFVDGGYNGIAVRGDTETAGTDLRKALARIVKDSGRKFDVDATATVPAKRNSGSTRDGRIEFAGMVDAPDAKGKNKQVARFTQLVNGIEEEVQVPQTQAAELRDLLDLRDKLRTLQGREQEILQADDEVAANMRRDLNSAYEDYVGKYGPITRATTTVTPAKFDEAGDIVTPEKIRKKRPEVMSKFEDDESAAEVFALEKSYSSETNTAQKSDLFESRQSSLGRVVLNETDDPREAVAIAAEMAGTVDLDSVARVLKVDKVEARERIRGLAFNDPSNGDKLTPRTEYLSGNVRKKLEAAKAAAAADPAYEENVRELEAVLPADATISDLPLTLGAEWMGADVIEKFAKHLMGRSNEVEVSLERHRWSVQAPQNRYGRNAVLENETWGTDRRSFYSLLESVLKQQHHSIKVTSKDGDGNVYVDTKASEEATAKAAEIVAEFGDFVWGDAAVAKTLAGRYTDKFRAIVLPDYSGSPQRAYPGMTDKLELRAHQNDAVTRAVSSESVLFEHVVGSGKTYTMAATVMELRRTGQVRKPVMTVPSHMLDQWTREFKELYPDAKVLAADSSMLSSTDATSRKKFLARAANNDWDVVIMTREAFESVPVSKEALEAYLAKEVAQMREELERARANGDGKSVKAMEKLILAEEKRILVALEARKDDHGLNWESVGFDYVMADEAHDYKNLPFRTTMQGITSPQGADRARDMHMKVEVVRANAGKDGSGRVVAFATGTPISNSLAEMYTMTRFLRPDLLEEAGISGFDSWAATFAAVSSKVEMTTDGSGFQDRVRMRGFSDALGDGLRIWRSFSDVVGKKDVNLRVPSVKTGGRQIHVVPRTDAQDDAMTSFRERVMRMRPGRPKKGDDTHVAIIGDGRRAALDPRLMSKRGRDSSNISQDDVFDSPKFDRAADQIVNIWTAHKDDEFAVAYGAEEVSPNRGGLQMVMLDSSAPNGGLNGYDMLKERLVERGMDPKRIAYIQDAKKPEDKAELFRKAKQGEIDVIFGSSAALGTGTNVQNRLYAMHHIDGSWRPSDIEQREGRIVRQGNQYDEVELHVYATEATHDSKTWDMVAYKQAGLDAIASGTVDMKGVVFEDDVDPLLDYDLITGQASGNPLVIDRREVEGELKRLSTAARSHQRQVANARSSQQLAQIKRDGAQRDLRALELAQARVTDTSGENFSIEFGTYTGNARTLTDRNEAADDLGAALKTMLDGYVPRDDGYLTEIGSFGGLSVMARTVNRSGQQPRVELSYGMKPNERRYSTATPVPLESVRVDREQMDSGMRGVIASLESRLRGIDTRKRTVGERVSAADEEYAAAVQNEKRTFRFQGDLDSAQRRKDLLDKILVGDGSTDEKRVELVDANQEYAGLKAEASKSGRRPAVPSAGTVVEAPEPATASDVVAAAREPRRVAPRANEPVEVLDAAEVARDAEDLGISLPAAPRTPRTPREAASTVEGPADEVLDPAEVADDMRELGLATPTAPTAPAAPREAVTRTPEAPNVADEIDASAPSQVAPTRTPDAPAAPATQAAPAAPAAPVAPTADTTPELQAERDAYRRGFQASKRSTTADLDGAESRFLERYGRENIDSFIRGWTDHAIDAPYSPPVAKDRPTQAPDSVAVPREDLADDAAELGINLPEAPAPASVSTPNGESPWPVFEKFPGLFSEPNAQGMRSIVDAEFDKLDLTTLSDEEIRQLDAQWPGRQQVLPDTRNGALLFAEKRRRRDVAAEARQVEGAAAEVARIERENNGSAYRDESLSVMNRARLQRHLDSLVQAPDGRAITHRELYSQGVGTSSTTNRDGRSTYYLDLEDGASYKVPKLVHDTFVPASRRDSDDEDETLSPEDEAAVESLFTPGPTTALVDVEPSTPTAPDPVDVTPTADDLDETLPDLPEAGDVVPGLSFANGPDRLVLDGQTFDNREAIKAAGFLFGFIPGERARNGAGRRGWVVTGSAQDRRDAVERLRAALSVGGDLPERGEKLPGENFPPTDEQQDVIDSVLAGKDTVVRALAGTGKTTTLEAIARRLQIASPNKRALYVAFNKSIQVEAEGRMPSNVESRTANSLAYGAMPDWMTKRDTGRFDMQAKTGSGAVRRNDDIARHFGITSAIEHDGVTLQPDELAAHARRALGKYVISADDKLGTQHVDGASKHSAEVLDLAGKMWADLQSSDGKVWLDQDHMVKMWALNKPNLQLRNSGVRTSADMIFFDEAQDINPVLAKVIADQKVQKVYVGDGNQAIYGFRGAVDQLDKIDVESDLPLTQSWRFGPEIADAGNRFLDVLGSDSRVIGGGPAGAIVKDMVAPDAVLTRSNGGMIEHAITAQAEGRIVGVPAGTRADLRSLVESARWLKARQAVADAEQSRRDGIDVAVPATPRAPQRIHDDLAIFSRWGEVNDAVERGDDPKVRMLARIVDGTGVDQLDRMVEQLQEADRGGKYAVEPDVVITTAHKAKGMEWDRVKIADDFTGPKVDPETGDVSYPSPEELRLAYVAVTRAQKELDAGSLGWVYDSGLYPKRDANAPGSADRDADLEIVDRADLPTVEGQAPLPAAPEAPETIPARAAEGQMDGQDKWAIDPGFDPNTFMVQEDAPEARIDETRQIDGQGDILDALDTPEVAAPATIAPAVNGREIQRPAQFDGVTLGELETPEAAAARLQEVDAAAKSPAARENYINALAELQNGIAPELSLEPDGNNRWRAQVDDWNVSLRKKGAQYFYSVTDADGQTIIAEGDVGYDPAQGSAAKNLEAASGLASRSILHRQEMLRSIRVNQADDALVGALPSPMSNGGILDGSKVRQDVDGYSVNDQMRRDINQLPDRLAIPGLRDKLETLTKGAGKARLRLTRDGEVIADGVHMNADGQLRDGDGNPLPRRAADADVEIVSGYVDLNGPHTPVGSIQPGTVVVGATFREADEPGMFDSRARGRFLGIDSDGHGRLVTEDGKERVLTGGAAPIVRYAAPDADQNAPLDLGRRWWENPLPSEGDTNPWAPLPAGTRPEPAGAYFDKKKKTWSIQHVRETNRPDGGVALSSDERRVMTTQVHVIPQGDKWLAIPVGRPADRAREFDTRSEALQWGKGETKNPDSALPGGRHLEEGDLPEAYRSTAAAPTVEAERVPDADAPNVDAPDTDAPPVVRDVADTDGQSAPDVPPADTTPDVPEADRDRVDLIPGAVAPEGESPSQRRDRQEKREASLTKEVADARAREGRDAPTDDERERRNSGGRTNAPNGNGGNGGGGNRPDGGGMNGPGGLDGLSLPDGPSGPSPAAAPLAAALLSDDEPTTNFHNPARVRELDNAALEAALYRAAIEDDQVAADVLASEMDRRYSPTPEAIEDDVASLTSVEKAHIDAEVSQALDADDDAIDAAIQEALRKAQMGAPTRMTDKELIEASRRENASIIEAFFDRDANAGVEDKFSRIVDIGVLDRLNGRQRSALYSGNGVFGAVLAKHLPEELTLAVWDRTPDEMRKNNEVFRWPGTRSSREFIADAELAFREELHAFDTRLAGIAARPATPGQVLRERREALSNDSGDGLAMVPTRALLPGDVIDTPESGPREVLGVDRVPDGIRVTVRAGDRAEVLTLEADGVTPVNASTARTLTTPDGIGARSTGAVQVDHHGRVLPNGNPAAVAPDTADGYSHDLLSGLDGTTVKAVAGDVTLAGLLEERDGSFLIGGEYIVPSDLRDMTLLTGARELPGPERALSDLPDNSAVRVRTPEGVKDGVTFLGLSDDPNMVHFIPSDGSPSIDLPKDAVVGTVAHYQSPIEVNRTVPGMWRASEHGTFASTAGIWNASVTPDKDGKHRWSVKGNDSAGDSSLNDEGVADTLEQAQEAVADSLRSWERDGYDVGRMPFTAPKRADRPAGAPDYDPDGIDGHAAQWTPVNDIPIGAPVRMLGVDHNGDEVTLSGVSLSWPQKVKVQFRGEPEPTLMLAVVVGEKDGTNRRSVFTRLDSLAATADAPALTDANQLLDSAELDAMSGRLGDYVPVDQNGRGIFPGNLVQDVSTGREGIVLDSRNLDVAVRWNDGREGDVGAVGLTNTSTDFRPEGWTDGGRRVTPGDTAILGDGREGTVTDAVGDVVTVKTSEGDYVDAPINEATISAPTGARKVDNGKPRLAIEEIKPAGTTLLAPLQEEAVDVRLDADNLALLRDLGFEGDALSDETVVAAAIRARTGAGLSRTQADALADAVAHAVIGDTDTDRVARARRLEENLRNTAAPESRDIVDPPPADRTAEVNDAALAEFIDERPRTASDTVGEHAANATTLATTLHELRQVVAEALASEELDASLERVARRFYDDADTIGIEGPERERVLDEARVAAERAKEQALAAVLATINDAERRTGESFEETRDRIARDILTASRQAGNWTTAPRTLAPSVPTPRPVTPDTPVAPVQSELPGLAPVPDELLEEVLFHLPGGSDLTLSQREAARQRLMEVGDDHARRAIQELLDQVPEGDLTPKMVERLIAQTTKALENDAAATARALEAASLDLPNRPTRQRGNYTRGGVKVPNYPSAYDRTMFRLGAWLGEVALRAIRAVVRAIQKLIAKLREKNEEPRLPRQRRRRPDRRPRRSLNSRKRGASKPGTAVVIEEEDPNLWGADLIRMAKEDAEAALKAESVTPRSIPAGSRPSAKAPTAGFGNRGELPENLDVAADGGPGSVALAHLESVIQSGSGVNPAGNGLHTKAWDAHLRSQEVSAAWRQALVADSPDLDRRQADHWEAQREAQLEAVAAANLARRDLEALREIREMGETLESRIVFTGDPEAVKSARWAMQHYPTDWIAKVSESGPIHVAVDDERGSYADRTLRVTAENDPKLIVDGAGPYGAVAIHEAAHMFEVVIPELGVAQWTYHNQRTSTGEVGSRKRTGRNATSLLGSQFPGEGYDDDEVARIDNYPLPYMGREYSDTDLTHFELMSVLMESLFGGAAVVEPEMRQFALGVLADLGKDAF